MHLIDRSKNWMSDYLVQKCFNKTSINFREEKRREEALKMFFSLFLKQNINVQAPSTSL